MTRLYWHLWYATRTVEHDWSRNILAFQIAGRLHARQGKTLNNLKLMS